MPELLLSAEILNAARESRRKRIAALIRGKDNFDAYSILLAEIASEV